MATRAAVPHYKKSWSEDGGAMRQQHRKVLHRCRLQLIKMLELGEVLEAMSVDDGFQPDTRDFILGFATSEQRVAAFIDRLEMRNDRSFQLFLDTLKEKNEALFRVLDDTLKAEEEAEEGAIREKTVTGEDIRRIIEGSIFQPSNHVRGGDRDDLDDLDIPIGHEEQMVTKPKTVDSDYLDCYCIPLLGKVERKPWINYMPRETSPVTEAAEDKLMVYLLKDITFVRVERSQLPDCSIQIPNFCSMYVVDVDNTFAAKNASILPVVVHSAEDALNRGASLPSLAEPLPMLPPLPHPSSGSVDNILAQPSGGKQESSLTDMSSSQIVGNSLPRGQGAKNHSMEPAPPVPPKPTNLTSFSLPPATAATKPKWERLPVSSKALDAVDALQPPPRTTSKKSGEVSKPVPLPKPDGLSLKPAAEVARPVSAAETDFVNVPQLPPRPRSMSPSRQQDTEVNASFTVVPSSIKDVPPQLPKRTYKENSMYNCTQIEDSSASESNREHCSRGDTESLNNKLNNAQEAENKKVTSNNFADDDNPYEPIEARSQVVRENHDLDALSEEGSMDRLAIGDSNSLDGTSLTLAASEGDSRSSSVDEQKSPSNDSGLETNMKSPTTSSNSTVRADEKQFSKADAEKKFFDAFPDVQVLANDVSSDGDSCTYEHIGSLSEAGRRQMSTGIYLDPHDSWAEDTGSLHSSDVLSPMDKPSSLFFETELEPTYVFLAINSLLLCSMTPACTGCSMTQYNDTCLAFDKKGRCFFIPRLLLKKYGDPTDEPWFYPVKLSSRHATLFMSEVLQDGCFLVYEPINPIPGVAYNLSISRENGNVLHYHIKKTVRGDLLLEHHDRLFVTLKDLVEYFQRNRSSLAVRLRRPLKYAQLPIIPGHHYDLRWEIDRSKLRLSGKIVGRGNYGVVCVGSFRGQSVAVKVLQKTKLLPEDEDDFVEEAKVLMRLRYDHIVRLVGLSCSAQPFYLVTEFVKKGNLRDSLRDSLIPGQSMDMLFDFCLQATAALLYLENQRFVLHRDIAARNFLVSDDLCIKLADFGRARFVTDDVYQASRTETLSIKWAAPEVLSHSTYSSKSDLWALGIVCWEIFSRGERPYAAMSSEQAAMFVMDGGRLEKPAGCPSDLFNLMKTCWLPSPDARPTVSSFYGKLSSKSSIYYSGHSRPPPQPSIPRGVVAQPVDVKLPIHTLTANRSKTIDSSGKHSRLPESGWKKGTMNESKVAGRIATTKSMVINSSNRVDVASARKSYQESSSETSLAVDRDDLSRGDKIRKSLRKFMSLKPKTKALQSSASLSESTQGTLGNSHVTQGRLNKKSQSP